MPQGYTNDVTGALTTAYTSGGTSLIFTISTGALPTSGLSFILKVDSEYFLVSSYTVLAGVYTATVVGAQDSSNASNHLIAAVVSGCWWVPSVIDGIRADQNQYGADASLPSTAKKGDTWVDTDLPYQYNYSGSSWIKLPVRGLTLLEEHTASNSAELDFTTWYSSAFNEYLLVMSSILPASNGAAFMLQFSTNGGSSYDTGNNYGWQNFAMVPAGSGANGSNTTSAINLHNGIGNGTGGAASGTYRIHGPDSGSYTVLDGSCTNWDSLNSRVLSFVVGGVYKSVTAVNAFRLLCSSGNITSGVARVYGFSN